MKSKTIGREAFMLHFIRIRLIFSVTDPKSTFFIEIYYDEGWSGSSFLEKNSNETRGMRQH